MVEEPYGDVNSRQAAIQKSADKKIYSSGSESMIVDHSSIQVMVEDVKTSPEPASSSKRMSKSRNEEATISKNSSSIV